MPTKEITEYFNFLSSEDIRLKDSIIGIETILYEYIDCRRSPEEIVQIYQIISLEQVFAKQRNCQYLHEKLDRTRS